MGIGQKMYLERKKSAGTAGFSLIEVVFAGTILTIVALSLMATLTTNIQADNASRNRDVARIAAQGRLETVLAWADYFTIDDTFDDTTFGVDPLTGPAAIGPNPGRVFIDTTNPNLLRITVRVDWTTPVGDEGVELSTLLAKPIETVITN